MALFATGFSSFHGVAANPTEALIEELESRAGADLGCRLLGTRVLRVAARGVEAWLAAELVPALRAAATASGEAVLALHLGVDSGAERFRLESSAYNLADFRVADEDGWQPHDEPITARRPAGSRLRTALDLGALRHTLRRHGVEVSCDPGRFVCNYTYYLSLVHCQGPDPDAGGAAAALPGKEEVAEEVGAAEGGGAGVAVARRLAGAVQQHEGAGEAGATAPAAPAAAGDGGGESLPPPPPQQQLLHALFVHVPPFATVDAERQLAFLLDLLRALGEMLRQPQQAQPRPRRFCALQ